MSAATHGSANQVRCPECGTITAISAGGRAATDFCPSCDYPLFWVSTRELAASTDAESDDALYRAPGTSGTTAASAIACPACGERNPPSGQLCLRCSADLHPAPLPVPEPPSPPEPVIVFEAPAIVQCSHWPSWLVAAIASVVTLVLSTVAFLIWG